VDRERGEEVDGLVRPDPVVGLSEPFHLLDKGLGVGDLLAVKVLVFEAAVEPLDDAVGLRGVVPGADVAQLRVRADEPKEIRGLVGGSVEFPTGVKPRSAS
jgi:hypothetical protein